MLHIHRGHRADGLAAALGELLAVAPADPLACELVAVPTRGMERWLAQRLSFQLGVRNGRQDGVCANVRFPEPGRLLRGAVAAAAGVDPDDDPWLAERASWRLLEVVEESLGDPQLARLAAYLGRDRDPPDPVRQTRRLGAVRHLAQLFDSYALERPAMVRAWAAGDYGDGHGGRLADRWLWQAELWRRLRLRIGAPGPAERLQAASRLIQERPSVVDLPERLALFGLTRVAAGDLEILQALAAGRDVHLFLLHPSPALWEALAGAMPQAPVIRRREDTTSALVNNPLLRSWGRDTRELQLLLARAREHVSHRHDIPLASRTLLERIQADVREDRRPPGAPLRGQVDRRPLLDFGDRSIQIHACHGRARQVEVLRDAILHLLAEDPSLEPRDVIVMCPDIEAFAPLVNAVFAGAEGTGARAQGAACGDESNPLGAAGREARDAGRGVDLRVRLADRSLRQTNPLLALAVELLELAERRMTASQVLDLAEREVVRRRFGFDDEQIARLRAWVREAGIRWGLDAEHRAPFKLQKLPTGTWQAGLDRLLLGVAMPEDAERLWSGVLAVDDVESGAIDLAGRLAELIDRLRHAVDQLSLCQPPAQWSRALADAVDSLASVGEPEAWQRAQLHRILDELAQQATHDGSAGQAGLHPAEVRALLAERLAGRPTRANFRTGHLTVCTMYPMRSVPHRVVCLLGLDDGAFPRRPVRDGDDLRLEDPHLGERDGRAEDRQLLADALLAATERLLITYTGNDERTNIPRPPAVPVWELLDVVDATVRHENGPARDRVLVRHPLQPFDPKNFQSGALVPGLPWGFDRAMLHGARAMSGPRRRPGPFLSKPLPALDEEVIELERLVGFVCHPARAFLRARLQIALTEIQQEAEDELLIDPDALKRWRVGQRLLAARLRGVDGRAALKAEIARGTLPPGVLGKPLLDEVHALVERIVCATLERVPGGLGAQPVDVRVALADGRQVSGTVAAAPGDLLAQAGFGRLSPRARLAAWVRLVAASASAPELPLSALTIGRAAKAGISKAGSSSVAGRVSVARMGPLGEDPASRREEALAQLEKIVALHDRGMREPLPLYCATSAAYAQAVADGRDPRAAAKRTWTSSHRYRGEDVEPEHRLVLGGVRTFEELLSGAALGEQRGGGGEPPEPGRELPECGRELPECGGEPGRELPEPTRLGRYARALWDGLLQWESLEEVG